MSAAMTPERLAEIRSWPIAYEINSGVVPELLDEGRTPDRRTVRGARGPPHSDRRT